MSELTERQAEVRDYLQAYFTAHWRMPTIREMQDNFGIKSPNGMVCHLNALVNKGVIDWDERKARGIKLVGYKVKLVAI